MIEHGIGVAEKHATASRRSIAIILMRHEETSGEFVESTKDLQREQAEVLCGE
jgi:hypothetical protein